MKLTTDSNLLSHKELRKEVKKFQDLFSKCISNWTALVVEKQNKTSTWKAHSAVNIHINSKCWTKLSKCVYYLHNKTEMLLLYNYSRFNTYYTSVWSQKLVITDLWNLKVVLHYFININWMNEWFNYWNTKGLSKTLKIIINVKQS